TRGESPFLARDPFEALRQPDVDVLFGPRDCGQVGRLLVELKPRGPFLSEATASDEELLAWLHGRNVENPLDLRSGAPPDDVGRRRLHGAHLRVVATDCKGRFPGELR